MNTQNPNNVFVFDMDNTLIKTDKANSLAYSKAISSVLGVNCNIENGKRFTRDELKELFPQLTQTQIDEIIDRKEKCFESYLSETELNNNLFSLLKRLHREGHHTILLTNCHSKGQLVYVTSTILRSILFGVFLRRLSWQQIHSS